MKFDKGVMEKLWRLLLRAMPLVPGPELFDLVSQITRSQKDIDAQVNEALESIQKTSTLVSQLEVSLKERSERLEKLQKQHDHYLSSQILKPRKQQHCSSKLRKPLARTKRANGG